MEGIRGRPLYWTFFAIPMAMEGELFWHILFVVVENGGIVRADGAELAATPVSNMKILLTSVCRPMGPKHGDAASVGYELLYRQVTRAQGIFSPRTVNVFFGLDYIAENLDVPTVVLQYPSKRELIKELKKGYDYIGVSFIMALMHKMKETVALIRKYAPNSKIVLGGYGTVLKDEVLKPYGDFICREEGVAFMRRLLG